MPADPSLTETAIVVLVPESENAVAPWRRELDPSAALGVPAHITLLYPFAKPGDVVDDVVAKVARTVRTVRAFEYELDRVRWFDETTAWLSPDPVAPFVALTKALVRAFPEFPRYGGSFGDSVVPHLTIGDRAPPGRLRDAARSVGAALPIRAAARDIAILRGGSTPGSWHVAMRLPLG